MSDVTFDIIDSDRIILRRFKESDAEAFFRYRPLPEVAQFQGEGWDSYTFERSLAFVKEQAEFKPGIPGTWFQIAIEEKSSGKLIGDCAVHTLQQDKNQVEIGFTLNPIYQGRGFAAEAVKLLLCFIFVELKKHRVIAVTDTRNINSIKLLEQVGMRREGHFVKNAWYRGEYTDEYIYAMLREEWLVKNASADIQE